MLSLHSFADALAQNAFLIKQGSGRIQFSREKGNLLNTNSFRSSGLANSSAIHIGAPNGLETPFAVKSGKKFQNSNLKSKARRKSLLFILFPAVFL
jgi:hypothetical protein